MDITPSNMTFQKQRLRRTAKVTSTKDITMMASSGNQRLLCGLSPRSRRLKTSFSGRSEVSHAWRKELNLDKLLLF
jgi:hypothetical protein